MINSFITALRTLSLIPIKGKDTNDFASSLPWFPIVGFFIASILSGVILLINNISNQSWNTATAFVTIILTTIITGALHIDGFADWADSLGGRGNKEKMLTIMKDSNSGVFGVVSIILLLLGKWIALVKLLELGIAINTLFIAYISSRFAMVYLSVSLPYARSKGGTGEQFVKGAKKYHLVLALVISLLLLFLIDQISAIIFFIISFVVVLLWKRWCKKNLNGITGDLLGAGSEFVEIFIMFIIALFYNDVHNTINQIFDKL